jgi:hypothetical protein
MSKKLTLIERIKTEGAEAAYAAALAVCRDPKAPAAARAQASSTIMRAAGLFEKKEDTLTIPESEMTMEQLSQEIARLEAAWDENGDEAAEESAEGVNGIWN